MNVYRINFKYQIKFSCYYQLVLIYTIYFKQNNITLPSFFFTHSFTLQLHLERIRTPNFPHVFFAKRIPVAFPGNVHIYFSSMALLYFRFVIVREYQKDVWEERYRLDRGNGDSLYFVLCGFVQIFNQILFTCLWFC